MPRQPAAERQAEYEEIKVFALALAQFIDEWSLTQPPGRVGSPGPDGTIGWREVEGSRFLMAPALRTGIISLEDRGFSTALRGVRMAVSDSLEMTRDLPERTVREADDFLTARGCSTLTVMRERVWQRLPKVLKRGRIRDEEEYRLVIERLNDVSASGLLGEDRVKAGRMVAAYEAIR